MKNWIDLRSFLANRHGNIGITFIILLVPLITAVGAGLDFARAYNIRAKMQSDLDSALLAAVKQVGTENSGAIETRVKNWFAAQTNRTASEYTLDDINIDTTGHTITATAAGGVPTTLMHIANIDSVDVGVSSSVSGPGENYLNVYIALDKSPSMLLAATSAGQSAMLSSAAGCAFACHDVDGGPYTYNKKKYTTVYDLAVAMGVQLRTDVAIDAVGEVLDLIDAADKTHTRIKVGLYKLGTTATEVLAPTLSTSNARKKLTKDSAGMNSATSDTATYFDYSLTALKKLVGTAGDGTSASSPLKLVLMLTDGVQSERNWVLQSSSGTRFPTSTSSLQTAVTPINPAWCDNVKTLGATMGVLYTEYLPMTFDWGYNATVGSTMKSSSYKSAWGATIASGVATNVTRQTYIPQALEDCATSDELFISANSPSEISTGLAAIFQQYLSNVRLTN
ncbi:MAG: TadE/TadG family type IV pilus assembly protein [Allorhizobium sp.]